MEELREADRTNACIATASRELSIDDIKRMYAARKSLAGPGSLSRLDLDQLSRSFESHAADNVL
jgi:hypothetical protein